MGKKIAPGLIHEHQSLSPNHVYCPIQPVSVLSKSSLRSPDGPIFGARLDVQSVRDVGTVMGVLDGEPYEGKERFLSPGIHTFVQTSTGHDLVVFLAQAVNRHFRPIESNTSPGS